jgi:hypothetical protein
MNNDVCVKQPLHVSLTIYDYLVVNAIFGSIIVVGVLMICMFCDGETCEKLTDNCVFVILMHIVRWFGVSWVVVGSIMYWGEMDRSLCSTQTNDYLTASLILRIIMTSIELNKDYTKNEKT